MSGRLNRAEVIGWVATALVAAGLLAAALPAARTSAARPLDRLAPDAPGTTWHYREVTNGTSTGGATIRVVGPALVAFTKGYMVAVHVDNYLGRGQPHDELRYQANLGDRLVQLGTRTSATFGQFSPPQTQLQLPLTPGRNYTWKGTQDNPPATITITTRVVGVETLTVAGQRVSGCPHLHAATVQTASGQPDFRSTAERWVCPGIGEVRDHTEIPSASFNLDEQLDSAHGPGINVGPPTPITTTPSPTPDQVQSGAPALETSRLAWSDSRSNALLFAPTGRARTVVFEEDTGQVSVLDPVDGELRWSLRIPSPAAAAPAVSDKAVLVPDAAKHLLALDPATGATLWVAQFPDVVSAGPLVVGDSVLVGTEDGGLHALTLADGRSRWVASLGRPARGLALDGDNVVTATANGSINAWSATMGALRWSAQLPGGTSAGPAVGSGVVVVADNQNQLSGLDGATGRIRWTDYLRTSINLPLVVAGTNVLTVQNPVDSRWLLPWQRRALGQVSAFDLHSGRQRWSASPGDKVTAPAVVGDEAVVQTRAQLIRLALATGERRGALPLPVPAPSLRPQATLPPTPTSVSGQLLVTVTLDTGTGWPRTTILAFPEQPDAGPPGYRFVGEFRKVPSAPSRAPLMRGNDLLTVARDGTVSDTPAEGPTRPVLKAKASAAFLAMDGDTVLARDGDVLVASAPNGRRWTFPLGPARLVDIPAASPTSVFVPVSSVGLVALSPDTGRPQWAFPSTGVGGTTPLILPGGDVVYAVGGLTRLDAATGLPRWQLPSFDAFGPLGEDGGTTIFASGLLNGTAQVLLAVDEASGAIRWQQPFPVKVLSAPQAANSTVVAIGSDDVARAFDAASGQLRWSLPLATPPSGSPVIVGDKVVITEEGRTEDLSQQDHRVSVHDLATGRFLGSFEPSGTSFGIDSFGATGDRLLIPTNDAFGTVVYILRLAGL